MIVHMPLSQQHSSIIHTRIHLHPDYILGKSRTYSPHRADAMVTVNILHTLGILHMHTHAVKTDVLQDIRARPQMIDVGYKLHNK